MQQMNGVKVGALTSLFRKGYRFRNVASTADVGVEMEIEGGMLPSQDDLVYHWNVTADGSLRGPSAEYVLKKPVPFAYFKSKSLPYLTKAVFKKKSQLAISERCSTHIHVNVQPLFTYQMLAMGALYYVFELIGNMFLAQAREGNLFCVGASSSSAISRLMTQAVLEDPNHLMGDKYAAVNFSSVKKYGSLEFRALQGSMDEDVINNWIEYLLCLRDYAAKMTPADVGIFLNRLSEVTPAGMIEQVFNRRIAKMIFTKYSVPEIEQRVYQGIENIQPFFFEPNWNELVVYETADQWRNEVAEKVDEDRKSNETRVFVRCLSDEILLNKLKDKWRTASCKSALEKSIMKSFDAGVRIPLATRRFWEDDVVEDAAQGE